jgi:LysM repeat protein
MRQEWKNTLFALILSGLLISACAPGAETLPTGGTATATQEGTLRPYPSDTPTATPLPTDYVSPTPSPTITPTPTDVTYEVQLNDDMYSIAFRYGLSPEVLMTANPDVDPRAMTVGMTLLIPITPTPPPTATPTSEDATEATDMPTETEEDAPAAPDCYLDATGGMWCFALVENDQDSPMENVSGLITLGAGEDALQETAITPLNLLPAGAALPLIAYFQPPLPADRTALLEEGFSLPVMPGDQRYLDLTIEEQKTDLSDDGLMATVSGTVSLSADQADADYVWVSATAFDADGRIVAVRRWENDLALVAGGDLDFEITLYSMAGPIDRVDLLSEAQPVSEATTP